MGFFDNMPLTVIERSLDASSLRQKVLSNNIANIDTPNFKRSDVSFDSVLQECLANSPATLAGIRSDSRHFVIGSPSFTQLQPQIVLEDSTSVANNGNNVDIDSEMSQLAENQLRYNTLVQGLNAQFAQLSTAINGGGR